VKIGLVEKVNASGEVEFHEASGLDTSAITAVYQPPDRQTSWQKRGLGRCLVKAKLPSLKIVESLNACLGPVS
jgi:hypothetical protein